MGPILGETVQLGVADGDFGDVSVDKCEFWVVRFLVESITPLENISVLIHSSYE